MPERTHSTIGILSLVFIAVLAIGQVVSASDAVRTGQSCGVSP